MFKAADFKEGTGGTPKVLVPGTHYVRIVDLFLEKSPFQGEEDAYFITTRVEDIDEGDDFEGFFIDKDNPSLGRFRGQIATVRSKRGSFKDYEYQGRQVERDSQMFSWINNLAKQWGVMDAMNKAGIKGDTIEEYFNNVKKFIMNPEIWGYVTLAGSEYFSEGYDRPNYNMFFPNMKLGKSLPFVAMAELADGEVMPKLFMPFVEVDHIIKKKVADPSLVEPVATFGDPMDTSFPNPADQMDVDLPFG